MTARVLYIPLWHPDERTIPIGCDYCGQPLAGLFVGNGWRFVQHRFIVRDCGSANPGMALRFDLAPNTIVGWGGGSGLSVRFKSIISPDQPTGSSVDGPSVDVLAVA
ncbi:hypothetical protein [Amycolatopsis sp. NPDC059657]|uniref:hypothetical protein n=1 Tax=Amycolatopsis sp. NPDC059657 TaxID=3346899 RepID=UPI00366A59F1